MISLVLPAFNEQEAIAAVIGEYYPFVDEIVVIDDGSYDRTYEIAKNLSDVKIKIIRHEKNRGKAAALHTGVRNATGDIIVFSDADFTYPAKYVPELVQKLENGAHLALGSRQINRENISLLNRLGNVIISTVAGYIGGCRFIDSQTGYRAFYRDMFDTLTVDAKGLEYETKMTVNAAIKGYAIAEVPVEYRKRIGISKLNPLRDGTMMLLSLLSVAGSHDASMRKKTVISSISQILTRLVLKLRNPTKKG